MKQIGFKLVLGFLSVVSLSVLFMNCSGDFSLSTLTKGGGSSTEASSMSASATSSSTVVGNAADPIRPVDVFPSGQSLLPETTGVFAETVPDTLDLAERAKSYLKGATLSLLSEQDYAPGGPAIFASAPVAGENIDYYEKVNGAFVVKSRPACWNIFPCIENSQVQNWGKVVLAMYLARRMSNYDADNKDGTLLAQLRSSRAMIDKDVNYRIAYRGGQPALMTLKENAQNSITPTTVVLESLSEIQQLDPSNSARLEAVQELVRWHQKYLTSAYANGKSYSFYWNQLDSQDGLESEMGTMRYAQAFIQGRAIYSLARWRNYSSDPTSGSVANLLQEYILSYNNSELWATYNPTAYPVESGQFVGQMHSYIGAVNGVLENIRPLKNTNPAAFYGYGAFAKNVYDFVKKRNRTGPVGHFGEVGTTGDMIRLGLLLTELGLSDQWEDVDAWTRNALAEAQIDDTVASYIPNSVGAQEGWINVGAKSKGLFLSDVTHAFSIPLNKNFRYNVDGPSNAMRAMYEVWKKSVSFNGAFSSVNLLLNRSTRYFEVKSHVPYRGLVEVTTRNTIGPLKSLGVRIPDWGKAGSGVQVWANGVALSQGSVNSGGWYWLSNYIVINNLRSNVNYQVAFNLPVFEQKVYTLRDDSQNWYEGAYPTTHGPENVREYTGIFRGNTLVDVSPRPSTGIPRFERLQYRNFDISKPTPTRTVVRSPLVKEDMFDVSPATPPTVLLNANGKSALKIKSGEVYRLSWSAANAKKNCTLAWVPGSGELLAAGSLVIAPNTSGSSSGSFIGTYTFTYSGEASGKVSQSVTITR